MFRFGTSPLPQRNKKSLHKKPGSLAARPLRRLNGSLIHAKTLLESVNTAARINKLLFACVERVTLGTNFHSYILLGGAGFDHIAAGTGNSSLFVIGVDSLFHDNTSFPPIIYDRIAAHHIISDSSAIKITYGKILYHKNLNLSSFFMLFPKFFKADFAAIVA